MPDSAPPPRRVGKLSFSALQCQLRVIEHEAGRSPILRILSDDDLDHLVRLAESVALLFHQERSFRVARLRKARFARDRSAKARASKEQRGAQ